MSQGRGKGRPKGYPKTGGRKKGSPLILPLLQKTVAQEFLDRKISPLEEIIRLIPTVSQEMQLNTWMRLMQYCYAALKTIEVKADINNTVQATPDNITELWMKARASSLSQDVQGIVSREISDTIEIEAMEPHEGEPDDEYLDAGHDESPAIDLGNFQVHGNGVADGEG